MACVDTRLLLRNHSVNVDLQEGDKFFWHKYRTVCSTWEREDGRLGILFTDGLTIKIDPAQLQEVK